MNAMHRSAWQPLAWPQDKKKEAATRIRAKFQPSNTKSRQTLTQVSATQRVAVLLSTQRVAVLL